MALARYTHKTGRRQAHTFQGGLHIGQHGVRAAAGAEHQPHAHFVVVGHAQRVAYSHLQVSCNENQLEETENESMPQLLRPLFCFLLCSSSPRICANGCGKKVSYQTRTKACRRTQTHYHSFFFAVLPQVFAQTDVLKSCHVKRQRTMPQGLNALSLLLLCSSFPRNMRKQM